METIMHVGFTGLISWCLPPQLFKEQNRSTNVNSGKIPKCGHANLEGGEVNNFLNYRTLNFYLFIPYNKH